MNDKLSTYIGGGIMAFLILMGMGGCLHLASGNGSSSIEKQVKLNTDAIYRLHPEEK